MLPEVLAARRRVREDTGWWVKDDVLTIPCPTNGAASCFNGWKKKIIIIH